MAVPAFRAAGAIAAGAAAGITPLAPAGLATNDIELLFCETANQAVTLTTANGFVEVTNLGTGTAGGADGTRITVFWRRWDGAAGDPVTSAPADHVIGRRTCYSGGITTGNPWDTFGTNAQAATTAGSVTGITTSVSDCLIVVAYTGALPDLTGTAEFSGQTNANLSSLLERTDNTRVSGNGGGLGASDGGMAIQGSTGATTYTSATSTEKTNFVIALMGTTSARVSRVSPYPQYLAH